MHLLSMIISLPLQTSLPPQLMSPMIDCEPYPLLLASILTPETPSNLAELGTQIVPGSELYLYLTYKLVPVRLIVASFSWPLARKCALNSVFDRTTLARWNYPELSFYNF
ncbi:hypothetical protein BDP27DRAFT_14869 [Rhodocollybia butyracea]|uniref:Uncharacterized protein n=1 Tax=Rhodocollybia butyracea TaxID=206335 RepID=A0A9P5Q4Y1_9AGAR|nr:hypothetical protein BDP27DRAFT_14869 [Rhodocollybia butyracea]